MGIFRKEFAYDIYAYLGFIAFYIIAYRDILSQTSLFWALNLIPLPSSAHSFVPGQFYWFAGSLGSAAQPNIAEWLQIFFVQLSGNNLVLAEKLLITATLASCFSMYFFLSNHFKGPRITRFSAALIYGFGPSTVLNFSGFILWGYVAIPIVFNYTLNLLDRERKFTDILFLGLSLSFMTAFYPQVLPMIAVAILIFLLVNIIAHDEKLKYLRKVFVSFSLSTLVFVLTSPYLISGGYQLFTSIGWVPSSGSVTSVGLLSSPFNSSLYFTTYANQEIANTIRLIGGSPGNHLPETSWIGFVLPILAFASLLTVRKGKKLLNLLALALISLTAIALIYGIHLHTGWAVWLLYHTPISLFVYPETPINVIAFAYSVMICVVLERLFSAVEHFSFQPYFTKLPSISLPNSRKIFSVLLTILLLASVFIFAPVFDAQIHQERYAPLPPIYSSIQNWLSSHSEGEVYRVMFLPTDSFSTVLGDPDAFQYTSGFASYLTESYVDFVYTQLVTGGTYNLGSLLAPASVKYVILATPDPSTLWNGTPALNPPLSPVYDSNGPLVYTNGKVQGNPVEIEQVLDKQSDLKLVYVSKDFRVYENMMYLPKISVFSSATYIVGSEEALSILPSVPGFSANTDMLIFADQNPSLAKELPEVSSSILFFNTDISNYANMLSSSVGSGSVYEDAMNAVSSKKQLYLFAQDSPAFSRSVTMSQGEYWIAVNVQAPNVTVDPSMGIINLDTAQNFVITRENFKPIQDLPKWAFDNANYYFVTAKGGNISVILKGSGSIWAYISHNATLSGVYSQKPINLPSNGTFNINLPPNSSFQPIVMAYNPAIAGQDIPDNLSEIIIENHIGGKYSIVSVDGANVTNSQNPDANGWNVFGPVYLDSGTHNFTITNGVPGSLVAIYNTANLTNIFGEKTSIDYNYSTPSETDYNVNINTDSSVFLSLSESYYPNWFAYSEGKQLVHFTGFLYLNAFYVNNTSSGDLYVNVTYDPPLLNYFYVMQQVLFGTLGLIAVALLTIYRIKRRAHNSDESN